MRMRGWLMALILVGGNALAAETGNQKLLVLGDSLSAAYGMPVEKGWVALLSQRLEQQNCDYQVINAGISGETTSGGLARLPALLREHQPDLVVLELGGNDGLRGLPLKQMQANLAGMIETVKAQGARVLLVGMRMPPNYGPAYTERFQAVYRELAEKHAIPLVPFLLDGVGGDAKLMQADRVHASADAQPRLLENVWKGLKPLLTDCLGGQR